tara:strand:+ start:274 stop:525 length:252 start_codon:yes stop_codon:yes gene_type:complete
MAYKVLTVGDLKLLIADLPDNTPVVLAQGSDGEAKWSGQIEVSNGAFYVKSKDEVNLKTDCLFMTSGYLSSEEVDKDPVIECI